MTVQYVEASPNDQIASTVHSRGGRSVSDRTHFSFKHLPLDRAHHASGAHSATFSAGPKGLQAMRNLAKVYELDLLAVSAGLLAVLLRKVNGGDNEVDLLVQRHKSDDCGAGGDWSGALSVGLILEPDSDSVFSIAKQFAWAFAQGKSQESSPRHMGLRLVEGACAKLWAPDADVTAPNALLLTIAAGTDTVSLHWHFDSNCYSNDSVTALNAAFVHLLTQVDANPYLRLNQCRLCAPVEAANSKGAVIANPGESLVAQVFAAADGHPKAVAVKCGAREIDFAQLKSSVNACAAYLQSLGVKQHDRVVVALDAGVEWIIAVLAVRMLGAAYCPLDPSWPRERLHALVARLSPRLSLLRESLGLENELVSSPAFWASHEGALASRSTTGFQEIAYVLHTSGSTGIPKAVQVSERSLMNYVLWASRHYDLDKLDASLVHTAVWTDLTVTSLWPALTRGKTVVFADSAKPIASALDIIGDGQAWLLKATPSHVVAMNRLITDGRRRPAFRGVLVVGGEKLRRADVLPWLSADPLMRCFDEYGPTEATVGCLCDEVMASQEADGLIGTPVWNTEVTLVDCDGHGVPHYIPGEIVVAGECVSAGYLGESSDKFITDGSGNRAYRTGDVAYMREDGKSRYVGRIDSQLKLRGFRLEPGEIEEAMLRTGKVSEVAVAKLEHESAGELLVAYCVVPPGAALDAVSLRARLEQFLPREILPNHFIQVGYIPIRSNGKRDVDALVREFPPKSIAFAAFVAPRTQTEEVLAAVFAHVLGQDRVGIDDDYYAMGGDSLRSVQITALAERRGVRFSLALLHEHPSVRLLASAIDPAEEAIEIPSCAAFALIRQEERARLPADIEDAYPLNLLQEGMIFHREFSPRSAVYHAICSYHISAPFDLELMRQAVQDLVNRHPLLRTSFDLATYGRPLELVHAAFDDPLKFEDLRLLDASEHEQKVDEWMELEKKLGFELQEFPLIRFMVHQFANDRFQLSYSFHHEIVDGWSDALMVTELMTQYMSAVSGTPVTIAKPTSSFRDAILLEREALENPSFKSFWLDRLHDVKVMRLPNLSTPKADKGDRQIVKFEVAVDVALSDAVKALARTLAVPLKTLLLAAHVRVMSMMGGGDDVMTYTVGNGRPENRDGHAVIGLFVNSLAFRQKLPGGSWADLVYDTLRIENELLPYRRYPMAEIKRQHGSEPLSETLFFFNNYHVAERLAEFSNLRLLGLKVYAESTFPYCMNAYLEPFTGKLRMRIEYDRLQYSTRVMNDIGDMYARILRAMVANPSSRYDTACLLSGPRLESVLSAAEGKRVEVAGDAHVLELFDAQVTRWPHRAAVVHGGRTMSYLEVDLMSSRLAARLAQWCASRVFPVAIAMPRCIEAIVAMLAAMKAGVPYIPMDMTQSADRLAYIVSKSQATVVVSLSEYASDVASLALPVLFMDDLQAGTLPNSDRRPFPRHGIAYVIYTSGSTGEPKGVAVDHRALYASTIARPEIYRERAPTFLLLSPHYVDSSVAGIYWTLCTGGLLVLPENPAMEVAETWKLVRKRDVTSLLCIPSLYAALLDELDDCAKSIPLREAIVAGEACPTELVAVHARKLPNVALYNEYGPTEATVWATVQRCSAGCQAATMPIGKPIPNVCAYVLDQDLNPVTFDVAAELYLAGPTLALGYLGEPGSSAQSFIPNPFAKHAGERLYRTGDIVRQREDGSLEFLGRTDQMVKIQGFRVEPMEVERVMERHPSVARALVSVRQTASGNELVAYVLPGGSPVDASELRAHAKRFLPKYMIPASIVPINTVPLKSSGKVDYGALPAPVAKAAAKDRPATETEAALLEIWRAELGTHEIGVSQDFFELGGESLRALRIIAKVRRGFNVRLPLNSLLSETGNIRAMARQIDEELDEAHVN